jgi:glycosyltransferase involved in cell wall biosynthesis
MSTMWDEIPEWVYYFKLCPILIINQSHTESTTLQSDYLTIINTRCRGLSKSRNLAANYCNAKYMLICDNDNHYFEKEMQQFFEYVKKNENDIYLVSSNQKMFSFKPRQKIRLRQICGTASWQICIKAEDVRKYKFDEKFGLGSGHVSRGEENILLYDLLKAGKKIVSYSGIVVYHPDLGTGYSQNVGFLRDQYVIYERMVGKKKAAVLIIRKFILRSIRKWLKNI